MKEEYVKILTHSCLSFSKHFPKIILVLSSWTQKLYLWSKFLIIWKAIKKVKLFPKAPSDASYLFNFGWVFIYLTYWYKTFIKISAQMLIVQLNEVSQTGYTWVTSIQIKKQNIPGFSETLCSAQFQSLSLPGISTNF